MKVLMTTSTVLNKNTTLYISFVDVTHGVLLCLSSLKGERNIVSTNSLLLS